MISRQELKKLASHTLTDAYFVSLYLNVDPKNNPKDDWLLHFKNLSKTTPANLPAAERQQVNPDIERIEKYLYDRPSETKRGLALISCAARNFWWVYHSMVTFRNDMVIKREPYIKPLMQQIDLYQRYLIVVISGEQVRLFIAGMGMMEPVFYVTRPEVSFDRTRDGNTGDMGELRAQRKKETSERMMFKGAAAAIADIVQSEQIKRILLGGSEGARGRFKDVLPTQITVRVAGEFTVAGNAAEKEILARAIPEMRKVEEQFEKRALEELFHKISIGGGSVVGLPDVLTALQQGNIRKMYIISNATQPGMVCKRCGALTPPREHSCPYCDGEMQKAPYIFDHIIQKGIDQGVRIDMIENAPELVKAGCIGALLRY